MPPTSLLTVQTAQGSREIVADGLPPAARLTELFSQAEMPLNTRCGQRGLCDGCLVEVVNGRLDPVEAGGTAAPAGPQQLVRACQYCLPPGGSATVRVPARSLLAHRPQVVTTFRIDVSRAHDPLWQTLLIDPEDLPASSDPTDFLCQHVARCRDHDLPIRVGPNPSWPQNSRSEPWGASLDQRGDHWQLNSFRGDGSATYYGAAVDIGTTTVVAMLVEMATGRAVETAAALNGQTRLGDNVVTRINLCLQDPRMVARLQQSVTRRTLRPLLDELLQASGAGLDQLKCLVVAGNTTMLHLLAGCDPSPLGSVPFTPEFLEHRILRARDLAILPKHDPATNRASVPPEASVQLPAEPPDPTVHLLPGAAAYVGADVVAGVFSTGMAYRDEPCLLVDVGTNGEIVLKHGARFWGCATAAGPAFEGAGLTSGVRAGHGAISHIRLEGTADSAEPEIEVIGQGDPIGVCGTAYVDFIAQARRCELIGPTGRFLEAAQRHPRLTRRENHRGFCLATGNEGKLIEITEADIASLLQAKAAIAAGIVCLLNRAGLRSAEVATLYLAGGFGFHMDVPNVLGCGLLPGFELEQIELVGNTSLAGAYLALMDSSALMEMARIAQRLEIVELNHEPEFESLYIDQLSVA